MNYLAALQEPEQTRDVDAMKHTIKTVDGGVQTVDYSERGRAHAIRYFCIECMGFAPMLPKSCTSITCPLFPYRSGPGSTPDFGAYEGRYKVEDGTMYEQTENGWQPA